MIQLHDKRFVPYLGETEILNCIQEMAQQINSDYAQKKPIMLGVLNGSFMFVSDLAKELSIECEFRFIRVSSYEGTESTGEVKTVLGLDESLEGRHVVILEDIIDTGNTVEFLLASLKNEKYASVAIATMLLKPDVFDKNYRIDYVGKNIPNKFVVGFGLDYDGLGRNLREIYQLAED